VPELAAGYEQTLARVIAEGLAEDVGDGDITTLVTVPADRPAEGVLRLKAAGVVAGLDAFAAVFAALDPTVVVEALVEDGEAIPNVPRDVARLAGPARALLAGERLALNLAQRMSGIATVTRRFVDEVAGTGAVILDTRKTAPGLRALDKRAVVLGGGTNHRQGLYDAILIKDNHIAVAGGLERAVELARTGAPGLPVEVEARTEDEVRAAVSAGADVVLLDNMDTAALRRAVDFIDRRAVTEASGGIDLDTVRAVAETGVDRISVGALTHSVRALDLSLEITT
jgi:nicotinate-nucleotide pyrophosphorylase (carboxylating)